MARWESLLKAQGFEVVNPLKLFSEHAESQAAQKQMLAGLLECNSIMLLEDWNVSYWGRMEFQLAHIMKYDIFSENDYRFLENMAETLRAATPLGDIPEESPNL